jgi:subtilisin family serine protease
VALGAVLGAVALLPAQGLAASHPIKPVDPLKATEATSGTATATAFGRTPPGTQRLIVSFDDTPRPATAAARLAGLGRLQGAAPEAGVWQLTPAHPDTARAAALARPHVTSADWPLVATSEERPPPPTPPASTPVFTDPFFTPSAQWGQTGATTWGTDLTTTGPRAPIAILDTGVDPTHPEWGGPASPLIAPRSVLRGDDDASDRGDTGHGTHVAGIAAAPANGIGIVGVAPAAQGTAPVIPVQIANPEGDSDALAMIKGIRHAVNNGAKVINISYGGLSYLQSFQDTILWAARKGVLVVASVGNSGQDSNPLNYPAGYARVLGVGAQCDGLVSFDCPRPFQAATFSEHNRSVDVLAPGVDILSTVPARVTEQVVAPGYALKSGTSMAAPFVTGVAALVQAANGNRLSTYQVERQIENTAVDMGRSGRDDVNGFGLVNPRAAVTLRAPADDPEEVNDDVKWLSRSPRKLHPARKTTLRAWVDRFEDQDDVYAIRLRRGQRIITAIAHVRGNIELYLWLPGTRTVAAGAANSRTHLLAAGRGRHRAKIALRAPVSGIYYVDVYARAGSGAYALTMKHG